MNYNRINLSDEELGQKVENLTRKIKLHFILMILGFILILPLMFFFPLPLIVFIPIFMIVRLGNELKRLINEHIVPGVLSEMLEVIKFVPNKHVPERNVSSSKLIEHWNHCEGSGMVIGRYKGVEFVFSNIRLTQLNSDKTKYKSLSKKHQAPFHGQWMVCKLTKEIPWSLQIRERARDSVDKTRKSDVETENIAFNKKFQILTQDAHTAFYVLTPHFMDYIISADNSAEARTYLSFSGKSLHIAIHNRHDLFALPKSTMKLDKHCVPFLRDQARRDIRYITGILDNLLQNEHLFLI